MLSGQGWSLEGEPFVVAAPGGHLLGQVEMCEGTLRAGDMQYKAAWEVDRQHT